MRDSATSPTDTLCVKTTDAGAREEMLQGFRPQSRPLSGHDASRKRSGSTTTKRTTSSKRKGKVDGYASEKLTAVGSVLLHPGGLVKTAASYDTNADPEDNAQMDLWVSIWPSAEEEEKLASHGLFLTEHPEHPGEPLRFNARWGPEAVNEWVRSLAPALFNFMDACFGEQNGPDRDDFHWVLARRAHNKLVLVRKLSPITGVDLERVRAIRTSVTRHHIPLNVYRNFPAALKKFHSGQLLLQDLVPPMVPAEIQRRKKNRLSGSKNKRDSESEGSIGTISCYSTGDEDSLEEADEMFAKTRAQASVVATYKGKGKATAEPSSTIVLSSDSEEHRADLTPASGPWTRARARSACNNTSTPSTSASLPRPASTLSPAPRSSGSLKRERSPGDSSDGQDGDSERPTKRVRMTLSANEVDAATHSEDGMSDFDVAGYLYATAASSPLAALSTIPEAGLENTSARTPTPPIVQPPIAGPSGIIASPSPSPSTKYYLERARNGLKSPGNLVKDPWN
ncbi:hypothetical protein C8Q73DRAFT_795394 [Cubamyces lactineus]|nr:hypothetical protein C8Q73DRAFT_795394 [Cubamyces lactineus]